MHRQLHPAPDRPTVKLMEEEGEEDQQEEHFFGRDDDSSPANFQQQLFIECQEEAEDDHPARGVNFHYATPNPIVPDGIYVEDSQFSERALYVYARDHHSAKYSVPERSRASSR